jgi:hypothetical protein
LVFRKSSSYIISWMEQAQQRSKLLWICVAQNISALRCRIAIQSWA